MAAPSVEDPPPASDHRWLILFIVAIAQLMVILDSTIVNIALPSAQHSLGFPNSERQWVVTAYALAFGSLLLLGGRLGDMFSRKRGFITGLIGFSPSSAVGGAARLCGMAVVVRTVAVGGAAVGLLLGGVLTEYLSWRWELYINLIFAAVAVAGALMSIQGNKPASRPRPDWAGTLLASAGLFCLVFGFSHAETGGWTAALTLGSLALGVVLLAAFGLAEQRVSHPLLPLRVILDRTRGGSYVAVGVAGIAIFSVFLFLTYYLQQVKGYSPVTCGLAFLPMFGCILVSSNTSSIVTLPRFGPRVLITIGMVLGGGAMIYLTQLTPTSGYASGVLPALLVIGFGFGMIIAPAINTATAGVSREDSGVASALVNTMQQVGGSIGTSALSTIALTATTSFLVTHHTGRLAPAVAATHGYTVAFAVSAGLFGLGVVLAIVLLPSKQRLQQLREAASAAGAAPSGAADPVSSTA